jgi:hypothetical protein
VIGRDWRARAAIAALLIGPAGCATATDPNYAPCGVLDASGWTARKAPSADGKGQMVQVGGTVSLPTGGFSLALETGPLLALNPPTQQVILRATPPAGPATQAITSQSVAAILPFDRRAQAVVVRCGDGVLAEIPAIAAEG